MVIFQALAGSTLIASGSILPLLLGLRGHSIHHQSPPQNLLAKICKIAGQCLYLIASLTCLGFIDIGVSVLFPGIGGPLATAQRMFSRYATEFSIGGACIFTAEALNFLANKV